MKAWPGSSCQSDRTGQHAGGHSGLVHPADSPLSPARPAGSGEAAGQVPAASPVTIRKAEDRYEVVDGNGLVLTLPILGQNTAAAIAKILDDCIRYGGLCLVHLSGKVNGHCLACTEGWVRHPFTVIR